MQITCPNCGIDVSQSEIEQRFGNELLSVFQCADCLKKERFETATFVLLPGGMKVKPHDVNVQLEKIECGPTDIATIISRAYRFDDASNIRGG